MQRRKEIVEGRSARRNFYRNDVINKVRRDCISFSSKHERNGGKSVIYAGASPKYFSPRPVRRVNAIITEDRRIRDNGGAE